MEDPLPEHVWDYIHYLNHKTDQGEVLLELKCYLEGKHEYMLLFDMVTALCSATWGREYRVFGVEEVVRHCKTEQPSEAVKSRIMGIAERSWQVNDLVRLVKLHVESGNGRYWEEWCGVMKRYDYLCSSPVLGVSRVVI